jgi:hypothetical protein
MSNCSNQKNPLQRSGTSKSERLLPGMTNGYAQVDERDYADWIVFAKEFARYLTYYELNGAKAGDWESFFSHDVSAVLGTIAIQDVDAYKRSIKERFDFLKDDDHVNMLAVAEKKLNELFCVVVSFCEALDEFYRILPEDVKLKSTIENSIKNSLAPALHRLLRYFKTADEAPLNYLKPGNLTGWKILGNQVKEVKTITEGNGLSKIWWKQPKAPALPFTNWNDYYKAIAKDPDIFGDAALDLYFSSLYFPNTDYTQVQWLEYMKINHAANHNLFAGVFDQFLMAFGKLVSEAEKDLLLSLESRNTHPAHYALFLVFLRLFRFAQEDINTITWRHLDYYYKEILRLQPKTALPNSAHIIAELAKPVDNFILTADTLFKAGKDSGGKEVVYALDDEETFNKAKVASLRSVYLGTDTDDYGTVVNKGRLFAAPMINAGDGMEAELTSPNKEWHPIANRVYVEGKVTDVNMPAAQIGFAVASHYLYLQEGERKVMLRLDTTDNSALPGKQFACYLTTEKEWHKVSSAVAVTVGNYMNKGTTACVQFSFVLTGSEPAITNYNAKVHGGTLNVAAPVLKILLINDETKPYEYDLLRDIEVKKLEVAVEVGMSTSGYNQLGVKQLQVSTDGGPVDTSKPFMPFGGQPRRDATLVIGSKEIFSKQNASVKLNIEWGGLPSYLDINYNTTYMSIKGSNNTYTFSDLRANTPYYPKVKPQFLVDGLWSDKNDDNSSIAAVDMFYYSTAEVNIFGTAQMINAKAISDFFADEYSYGVNTVNGFMRLVLDGDFGHKKYLTDFAAYMLQKNNSTIYPRDVGVLPIEPYTPVIQSLYISYSAYSDVVDINNAGTFSSKAVGLFHLYPFGDAEQHSYATGASFHYLFPQFRHLDKNAKQVLHEGEFYIGFQHIGGGESVNVLFQVMDGTADPKIIKPEEHIQWSYLSNNKWIDFSKQQISDATLQLIQSGIISFITPPDATTANTLMPTGYLWIKASVKEKTNAICKLLTVDAQAAVVTFNDNGNAADFLNAALPAASINKLKTPVSAIKKISQPYSSFGGRSLESSEHFYIRVSERLRHKARAITIWDYEHLILEAFPLIHQVKCLNHTKYIDKDYNEVCPGHVTIITIPDLQYRNDINPLRPYTNQNVLLQIGEFLKKKISCHVQLHVCNPDFEEVQLKFKLKLAKGYDDFTIYSGRLKEEITSFLSPWAFGCGELNFGGIIYKSVLINFIEERPYVDFILDLEMTHYNAEAAIIKADNDEIIASDAKSILVSVPSSKHEIDPVAANITKEQYECAYIEAKKKKNR